MVRLNKMMILKLLRKSNCIETPILNRYFESVWVGEVMRERIKTARRKMKI
jgi:hypothetical protein